MIPSAPFDIYAFRSRGDESTAGGALNIKFPLANVSLSWVADVTLDWGGGHTTRSEISLADSFAVTQRHVEEGNMDIKALEMNQGEFCLIGHPLEFQFMPKLIDSGIPGGFIAYSDLGATTTATVTDSINGVTTWTNAATTNPPDATTAAAIPIGGRLGFGHTWVPTRERRNAAWPMPGECVFATGVGIPIPFFNIVINHLSGFGDLYQRTNVDNTQDLDVGTYPEIDWLQWRTLGTFSKNTVVNETSGGNTLTGTIASSLVLS